MQRIYRTSTRNSARPVSHELAATGVVLVCALTRLFYTSWVVPENELGREGLGSLETHAEYVTWERSLGQNVPVRYAWMPW